MKKRITKSAPGIWPRGTWHPSAERIARANITSVMRELGVTDFAALHQLSVEYLEQFLSLSIAGLGIRFQTKPTRILDDSGGVKSPELLVGAKINIVESCFTADDDATAIIFSSPDG